MSDDEAPAGNSLHDELHAVQARLEAQTRALDSLRRENEELRHQVSSLRQAQSCPGPDQAPAQPLLMFNDEDADLAERAQHVQSVIDKLPEIARLLAERAQAEAKLREEREALETLNRVNQLISAQLDLERLVNALTDAATHISGAQFGAFFYNVVGADGESYMLYTLSGVHRDKFEGFPMPRNTAIFAPTFAGEGVVRLDDVTQDPRFGKNAPYDGMPAGHLPVRSYLAVPVVSRNGDVIGGLFFGHASIGVFGDRAEGLVRGIAAQAAIAMDNARLYLEVIAAAREREAILGQIADGVIVADPAGSIRFMNDAARRLHGVVALGVPIEGYSAVFHLFTMDGLPYPPSELPLARAVQRDELVLEAEWRIRRPDGTEIIVMGNAIPVRGDDGRKVGAVLTLRDVTSKRALEADRERLIAALESSNRELDQFAYVASHDLKAPLRGIANLSQWVEEDLGDTISHDAREKMRLIRGRVHRLEGLINGILSYSRAGRVREKPESIDVGALLQEAVELLAPPAGATIDIPEEMPTVVAERVPLQQVFMNLISNAVKYARRPDARVEIGFRDADQDWEFSVKDNGPGIAPAFHEQIWVVFQTLESRDKVEASGIGLSVVKKTVETRGGRVWVESAANAGATFYFTLPKRAHEMR